MSMELLDFLRETQAEVREQVSGGAPFAEMVFSEIVMQHMAGAGMTLNPWKFATSRQITGGRYSG